MVYDLNIGAFETLDICMSIMYSLINEIPRRLP
jgi:hypothetical protein